MGRLFKTKQDSTVGSRGSRGAELSGLEEQAGVLAGQAKVVMSAFRCMDKALVPFSHTGLSAYATSKYRRDIVCICRAPFGFIVTAGQRPHTAQMVTMETERVMDTFRR